MDNQSDKFGSGFIAGTIFGGVVGGFVGAFLANRLAQAQTESALTAKSVKPLGNGSNGKQPLPPPLGEGVELNVEVARQGLESKIAQLNDAIDDVRSQLGNAGQRES